jgi:hypothetical protein
MVTVSGHIAVHEGAGVVPEAGECIWIQSPPDLVDQRAVGGLQAGRYAAL